MQQIIVLSDGCTPTEDLYFWRSCRPLLKARRKVGVSRVDAQAVSPLGGSFSSDAYYLVFRSLPQEWVEYFVRHRPKSLIFLIDDHFQAAKETIQLPDAYREKLSKIVANRLPIIKGLASNVVVTSSGLEESYAHFSPLRLNPSMLDASPKLADFNQRGWKIGYHGTSSHAEDLRMIAPAIINTLSANRYTVFESLLGRHTPEDLKRQSGCFCVRPMSWSSYLQYRKYSRMHIGLAPLMDTPFNRGKSWVKFLDITASGGVGIYSNRAPYSEVVEDGVDGLLADDDPKHWGECLNRLIKHRKESKIMARKARKKALAIGHPKWSYRFWVKLLDL